MFQFVHEQKQSQPEFYSVKWNGKAIKDAYYHVHINSRRLFNYVNMFSQKVYLNSLLPKYQSDFVNNDCN